ncbi:MAG: transcriptional regulator NrdR [bacterium]|nr:transcriptional regulator NrdR [bacterium]
MRCPFCGELRDKVIDSRGVHKGGVVRRRRFCLTCQKRFTTYERVERLSFIVIKRDKSREPFDRDKIITGIRKACEKRPVSYETIEEIVDEIVEQLQDIPGHEVETKVIGEMVMDRLKELDEVAYVRFASVYRRFKSVEEFREEIDKRLKGGANV